MLIYKWERGEEFRSRVYYPDELKDEFRVLIIGEKDNQVTKAKYIDIDENNPEDKPKAVDIPELLTGIVLNITSPVNKSTLNVRNITVSGTIKADNAIQRFEVNGKTINPTGDSWFKDVSLEKEQNAFYFLVVDSKGNSLRDTLVLYFSTDAEDKLGPVITMNRRNIRQALIISYIIGEDSGNPGIGMDYIYIFKKRPQSAVREVYFRA